MSIKVPYAIKDGKLIHISFVASGRACGCLSPIDGTPVIARKGNIRRHHFALQTEIPREAALETIYHLLAKQFLEEEQSLALPKLHLSLNSGVHMRKLQERRILTQLKVQTEQQIAQTAYRADSIVTWQHKTQNRQLVVEWVVTHSCDAEKTRGLKNGHISGIEVTLGDDLDTVPPEQAKSWILFDAPRSWIWHPLMEWQSLRKLGLQVVRKPTFKAVRFYKTRNGVRPVTACWVKHCPLAKKTVSTRRCRFCPCAYRIDHWQEAYVDCLGGSTEAVRNSIEANCNNLDDIRESAYDGIDWYENAAPNLGDGFKRGWDLPRKGGDPQARLEIERDPYSVEPTFDSG